VYRLYQPIAGGVGTQNEVPLGEDEVLLDADNEVYYPISGEVKRLFKTTGIIVRDLELAVRRLEERVKELERGPEPEPQRGEKEVGGDE